ncbi:MAG: MipA/OmpV family protein [Nevskiales bacterium]
MRLRLASLALLFFVVPGQAAEKPLWELGAGIGVLDFPDYRGSDERSSYVLPIPYVVYRGEIFKVDRDSIRGELFESQRLDLDISLNGSIPVDSDDNEARRGMDDLEPTVEIGPELNIHLLTRPDQGYALDLRLPLRAVISTEFEHVGWIAQPKLNLDVLNPLGYLGWRLGLQTSVLFGDRQYHAYFYDVAAEFALANRPAYEADAGYSGAQAIASLSKRFPKFWLGGFVKWDSVDGAKFEDSPLVRKQSHFTAGLAVSWIFKISDQLVTEELE